MEKTINLRDWSGQKIKVSIPDFEQVTALSVEILSGDEVLTAKYEDRTEKVFDSSKTRWINIHKGEYELPLSLIDEFSNFNGYAFECEDMIAGLVEGIDKEEEKE